MIDNDRMSPVNDQIQVLGRKVACAVLPRRTFLRRTFSDGTIVGGPNRAGYGGRGAFVFGERLEPELGLLPLLLRPGGTFVDIGANSGIYSLTAGRIVGPNGIVLSLEPNPEMLAVLHRNVAANRLGNVRARGLAVADRCAALEFHQHNGKPNSFSLEERAHRSETFSVLAVDLDTLLSWEGIAAVDVMKIDAEGSEDRILAGAASMVAKCRPAIIAEYTKSGLTDLPPGYDGFRPRDGETNNTVLVPAGGEVSDRVVRAGWRPL